MGNAFVEYVAPSIGNVVGLIMLLSPTSAVLNIRKTGSLGDVNPLPYPMTWVNCLGWVLYAVVIRDAFIFPANIVGLLGGMCFTMVAYPCADRKMKDLILLILLIGGGYFCIAAVITTFGLHSDDSKQALWGTSCVVILMIYYIIPITSFYQVIKSRNAASIYLPMAAAGIANGSSWFIYGLAVGDVNIWLPNGIGAIFGIIQCVLRFMYGARASTSAQSVSNLMAEKPMLTPSMMSVLQPSITQGGASLESDFEPLGRAISQSGQPLINGYAADKQNGHSPLPTAV